jgi:hypothetical protein
MTFAQSFKEGFEIFGESIATLINTVLLTVVYFAGIGMTSILSKLMGKQFIHQSKGWNDMDTYKAKLYRRF